MFRLWEKFINAFWQIENPYSTRDTSKILLLLVIVWALLLGSLMPNLKQLLETIQGKKKLTAENSELSQIKLFN